MNIGKSHLTQVNFDKLWNSIQHELTLLYNNKKCSALIIYNNIYIVCTSTSHKYVEDLYWKIGDFLYEILKNNMHNVFNNENWINEYIVFYEKYLMFVNSINDLADYLNQYITTKSIYHFAFLLWEKIILQNCFKYKKVNLGEYLVFHENIDEVEICLRSLKHILVDPSIPLLYYTERYEKFALSYVIDKCTQFVNALKKEDVTEYIRSIHHFIKNEKKRRTKVFLLESWNKHDLIVEDILVVQKKKWIKNEIYKKLMQHTLPVEILDTIRNSMSEDQKCTKVKDVELCTEETSGKYKQEYKNTVINDSKKDYKNYYKNRNNDTICKNVNLPHIPLNDFYVLFSSNFPNLYTWTTQALNDVTYLTKKLSIVGYGKDILDEVLTKYLNTQLLTFKHLLDKKTETLYIFLILFTHVVKIGFNNLKSANDTLIRKLKDAYNSLTPSLSDRLITFSDLIALGNCVIENKHCTFKKAFIDFYTKNDICNLNEEEDINYLDDNESTSDSENTNQTDYNHDDLLLFVEPEDLSSLEDCYVKDTVYTQKRNTSLPDLSLHTDFTHKDAALLRVFIHLYNLVDDKIDFYKKYLQQLSKRVLLYDINYYKELELFNLLQCDDRDLKLKGEIMFFDMKSLISTKSRVHLLTESAWCLDIEQINIIIPNIFRDDINSVSNKKVKWAWEYSTVIIEMLNNEYRMNLIQYLIVSLFNKYDCITESIIELETGLTYKTLSNTIKSLIKSKFVYLEDDKIFLCCNCTNKNIVDFYIKDHTDDSHEINKEMYYLSKIANIMKRYKKMLKEELANQIKNIQTEKFNFREEDFFMGLKTGIEKGIVEELDDVCIYIP